MVQKIWCVLVSSLLLFSSAVMAKPELYQAEVSAEQTQQQWQREALTQILIRVTGNPDIMQRAELRAELNNAASYVKQFEAVRDETGNKVRVLLDAERIRPLLQQLQIPIWGGQRPEMLFWLVEQQGTERRFVRQTDEPWVQALTTAMAAQALPLTLPLYDIDDLLNLTENDVWGGFWEPVLLASSRYRVNEVVLLLLEATSETDWRLTAIRNYGGQLQRDEFSGNDKQQIVEQYTRLLSQQLARQYAIVLDPALEQQVRIQVQGTASLRDVVLLERALAATLGVKQVKLLSQGQQQTDLLLTIQITAQQLLQLLAFEPMLSLLSDQIEIAAPAAAVDAVAPQLNAPLAVFQLNRS
jgi:hypothetical protein